MAMRSNQICIKYLLSCHNSTAGGGMKESCAGSQERLQTVSAGPGTGAGGTAPFWRHELQRQGLISSLLYSCFHHLELVETHPCSPGTSAACTSPCTGSGTPAVEGCTPHTLQSPSPGCGAAPLLHCTWGCCPHQAHAGPGLATFKYCLKNPSFCSQ